MERKGTMYHDFPRLAKESGFAFMDRQRRLDWKLVEKLDVEKIAYGRQFEELERCLDLVLTCDLDGDMAKVLDCDFVKLFRLSQLGISYLSYCLSYLDRCVILLQDQLSATAESNKEHLSKRAKLRQVFECKLCDKTFISATYLSSHSRRRHGPSTTTSATQTDPVPEVHDTKHTTASGTQTEEVAHLNVASQTDLTQTQAASSQTEDSREPDVKKPEEADKVEIMLDKLLQGLNSRLTAPEWSPPTYGALSGESHPLFVPLIPKCCYQNTHNPPEVLAEEKPTAEPSPDPPKVISQKLEDNFTVQQSSRHQMPVSKPAIEKSVRKRHKLMRVPVTVSHSSSESDPAPAPVPAVRRKTVAAESKPALMANKPTNMFVTASPTVTASVPDRPISQKQETKPTMDMISPRRFEVGLQKFPSRRSDSLDGVQHSLVNDRNEEMDAGSVSSYDSDEPGRVVQPPPLTRQAFANVEPLAASSPAGSPELQSARSSVDVDEVKEIGSLPISKEKPKSRRSLYGSELLGRIPKRAPHSLMSTMKKSPPKVLNLVRKSWTSLYSIVSPSTQPKGDLADRLRDLQVDPTWVGIPDATLKRSLEALAHNRRILAKKHPRVIEARRRIEEVVEQLASQALAPSSPSAQHLSPTVSLKSTAKVPAGQPTYRSTMYDMESNSSNDIDLIALESDRETSNNQNKTFNTPQQKVPIAEQSPLLHSVMQKKLVNELKEVQQERSLPGTSPARAFDLKAPKPKEDEENKEVKTKLELSGSVPVPILKKANFSDSSEDSITNVIRPVKPEGKKVMFAENIAEVKKALFASDLAVESSSSSEWDLMP